MIKEAIDKILNMAAPAFIEINGLPYSKDSLRLITPPEVPALEFRTLSSLVEYCKVAEEGVDLIHVESHAKVCVYAPIHALWGTRTKRATAFWSGFHFNFGQFYHQTDFVIKLQSQFYPSPDRDKLIPMVSSVKEETVRLSKDDGISQQVVASKGVLVENRTLPNTIALAPCRTFSESGVVTGTFVLRAKDGPAFALFDVAEDFPDKAACAVADYLKEQLPDITVLV